MPTPAELLSIYTTQSQISNFYTDKIGQIWVSTYGAVGDGVTDDTAKVQAAVNAAVTAGVKEVNFVSGKTYKITALTSTTGITFLGNNVTVTGGASITVNSFSVHLADVAAHGYLFRQALINGNFDVWQRNTLFNNPNNIYTVDRWKIADAVDTNVKILQSSTVPDAQSKYSLRAEGMTAAGGAGAYSDIYQVVEDYSFFAWKTVTFSGYVKCDAGASFVPIIDDGVNSYLGGTISDTAWKFFSLTATINNAPSLLKVYARLNRGGLAIGNGINLAQLQLCVGDKALPFSPRSFADELRLCQRYYEKSYDIDVVPGSNNSNSAYDGAIGASSSGRVLINFKVPKRISPTMKYYAFDGTVDNWESISSADVVTLRSLAFATIGKNGVAVSLLSSGADGRCRGHWTADAEL